EIVGTIEAEGGAGAVDIDPQRNVVVCVSFVAGSVTFADASTYERVGEVQLSTGACAVGVVPERGEAFVVNSVACTVSRVDLDRLEVVDELPVGAAPVGLSVAPAHDRFYVANRGAGTVSVVGVADGTEWARIPVGDGPGGVVARPGGRLYVANAGSPSLTIVDDLLAGRPPIPVAVEESALVGQPIPPFSLVDFRTGERRSSVEWAERRYIVNFFASW